MKIRCRKAGDREEIYEEQIEKTDRSDTRGTTKDERTRGKK